MKNGTSDWTGEQWFYLIADCHNGDIPDIVIIILLSGPIF